MGDGHIYCQCGHAIVSHDPAHRDGFRCCVRGCGCASFTRVDEKSAALTAMDAIVDDYFAFQAAACTTQADCKCGRH